LKTIHQNINPPEDKTMQLTYRGNQYTPCNEIKVAEKPTLMIYRGVTYTRTPAPLSAYRKPQAINWRYQVSPLGAINLPKHPFSLS
jgi:hypothetical protein